MPAVPDLPVLVARDLGFFRDEGLVIEFITPPGMAQVTTSHAVKFDSVFDPPLDSAYNEGDDPRSRRCSARKQRLWRFIAETDGLLDAKEFRTWRLLHAPPQPYTRERFDDEYNWTVKWNMTVPSATYENTVDNRAWQ
jgi:hypothetical protein